MLFLRNAEFYIGLEIIKRTAPIHTHPKYFESQYFQMIELRLIERTSIASRAGFSRKTKACAISEVASAKRAKSVRRSRPRACRALQDVLL